MPAAPQLKRESPGSDVAPRRPRRCIRRRCSRRDRVRAAAVVAAEQRPALERERHP